MFVCVQGTTFGSGFSPSTVWVPRIELKSSSSVTNTVTCLANLLVPKPSCFTLKPHNLMFVLMLCNLNIPYTILSLEALHKNYWLDYEILC